MQNWLNLKKYQIIIVFTLFALILAGVSVRAESARSENAFYLDKTRLIAQQIEILKHRLIQSKNEIVKLQNQQDTQQTNLYIDHVNKQMLHQASIDLAVAKSNLDSINIELSESQQTTNRLEKETQEIENQLNVYNIFGLKIARNGIPNLNRLQRELDYQKQILELEKSRANYLEQLQDLSGKAIQLYKTKYSHIELLLKSQTIMQLKEQQTKSEIDFQLRQSYWLQQLNQLYSQLNQIQLSNQSDKTAYIKLESQIFFANENVNFTYLQMLIARYQDQIRQLKVSISRTNSITVLDKVSEQVQLLGKQLTKLNDLLVNRLNILVKRNELLQLKDSSEEHTGIVNLRNQYRFALTKVAKLNQQLFAFRSMLDQALQQELSSRQGLPGLSAKAWLDLGAELMLMPSLAFQVIKNLTHNLIDSICQFTFTLYALLLVLEIAWLGFFYFLNYLLMRLVSGVPDHEYGHINLKWLSIKLMHRSLVELCVIGNLIWLFAFCGIPTQNFSFFVNLALVWLFFKMIITVARLCLVETVHDRDGHDVRLYHRLKWTFLIGGIITALTVIIHQLPLIYEVKDLFDRMFLMFLLFVSIFLLKSWEVLPGLILLHVDNRHIYLKRIVRLLGLLIPCILLINSAIGLFGFVNLVLTISWYESVFLMVLVGYLVVKGILYDAMESVSQLLIRHVSNGWLWTEAFLKPFDKVLRIVMLFCSGIVLFLFYGWDKQSPVVTFLNKVLHYHLIDMLNTSITPLSILELLAIISFLFWAARWTREFVYRLLMSRSKDMGVRNSIAILSQYTVILIGIFVCLRVLGIDFRALTVVAGMFAFGVGLGLRDLANNFACGFLLLIERPLRVGDTVSINEYEGEVTHIGGRAVTIRTWDHMEVLVPNAEIFNKTFMNWTAKDHIVRTVFTIKINRHDKPQDVQALIHQALAEHKDVLSDPIPEVFLKELTDGLIEFEIRYFINLRHVKSRIGVRSEVLVSLWELFEKHSIQPPYPHHEIYLKGGVPMLSALSQ